MVKQREITNSDNRHELKLKGNMVREKVKIMYLPKTNHVNTDKTTIRVV